MSTIASPALSVQRERLIAARWELWKPWALRETAKIVSTPEAQQTVMVEHHARHREHLVQCLRAGISWKIIIREGLDDPRMDDAWRQRRIAELAARHQVQVAAQLHRRKRGRTDAHST